MNAGGKLKIGILFGGKSAEHEVSIQSAVNIYNAVKKGPYEPHLIGIDKTGKWFYIEGGLEEFIKNQNDPSEIKIEYNGKRSALLPECGGVLNIECGGALKLDVIFPILHGPMGEDGVIQGALKTAGVPFVGCGVLASAASMDKDVCKRLLRDSGVPVARWVAVKNLKDLPFSAAAKELSLPLFIKPANMGSSVGVNKAYNQTEYEKALAEAFLYDSKILVEEAIEGREIECAVLGNQNPIASAAGEIIPSSGFYSYKAKYLDEKGAVLKIPAEISAEKHEEIKSLAVKTFNALCCEGLSRVDMFLKKDGSLVVNEINTMPGFTKISMYPKLWEAGGLSYEALIEKLINLAIERFNKEQKLRTSFF
ncbi:MAG: D-alanine--D-alanine ligase [Spirochaetaceae bacterium]|jgi:D-alanine-D-alanine ligase|nr:D-alanine--D-alanine ligase [Spirochaetaceae bacterium]